MFVKGSLVSDMTVDFEDFWVSPLASNPAIPKRPVPYVGGPRTEDLAASRAAAIRIFDEDLVKAHDYTIESQADIDLLKQVQINGDLALRESAFEGECNNLVYAADYPGVGRCDKTRVVTKVLDEEVRRVGETFTKDKDTAVQSLLVIESPYFIPNSQMAAVTSFLNTNNIKLSVMTNSLNSTDAFYTVAAFDQRIVPLLRAGIAVSIYDGSSESNRYTAEPRSQMADWGTHSKRAVMGNSVMVGTFNIDPRSSNINAEMILICKDNKAAATYVKKSIDERMQHAVPLGEDGLPIDGRGLHFGAGLLKHVEYWVSFPFTLFLAFLM